MRSLRTRAIRGAAIWAILSIVVGIVGLVAISRSLAARQFDDDLMGMHRLLVVALDRSGGDLDALGDLVGDPEYRSVLSGLYWQVTGSRGQTAVSRSLFDAELPVAVDIGGEARYFEGPGPLGAVRGLQQKVVLEDGTDWLIVVAQDIAKRAVEQQKIQQNLFTALALVGILGMLAAMLQLTTVLRPLTRLRDDVDSRWTGEQVLNPSDYPEEVAPLVADINLLLERNRHVIESSRRQAADLAHALKTPTAILRNEIEARAKPGDEMRDAKDALARIDSQILRSLARIRAGNAAAKSYRTDLSASAERLVRLFRTMPGAQGVSLDVNIEPDLSVAMDRQDIEEVLGNLLDNAIKWQRGTVRLSAHAEGPDAVILVDDDGPGVPGDRRDEALRAGGRLDTSAAGSGLGLAIASDLVAAYDGSIRLEEAPGLGGLRVYVRVPTLRDPMARKESVSAG